MGKFSACGRAQDEICVWIQFAFSIAAGLCAAVFTFHPRYELDSLALYGLGLVAAAAAASFWGAGSGNHAPSRARIDSAAPHIAYFLIGLAVGLHRIDLVSVWLDEATGMDVLHGPQSLVRATAIYQQQVPLNVYFAALNAFLLGPAEWGLRLLPCLFIAGATALFSLLASRLFANAWIRAIAPLLFLGNPLVLRYAKEGRPYAIALFSSLLWLNALLVLFRARSSEETRRKGILFAAASLLLFLSISFQSVLLALAFTPALVALYFQGRWRRKARAAIAALAAAAALLLPLWIQAWAVSPQFLHRRPQLAAVFGQDALAARFYARTSDLLDDQRFALFAAIAIALAIAVYRLARRSKFSRREITLAIGVSAGVAFTIFFWILYSALVNFRISPRYFLLAFPLALLAVLAAFDRIAIRLWLARISPPFRSIGALGIALALLAPAFTQFRTTAWTGDVRGWMPDYRAIFAILREAGEPGDRGYVVPFQLPTHREQQSFIASQSYYPDNAPVAVARYSLLTQERPLFEQILDDLAGTTSPRNLFFAFHEAPPFQQLLPARFASHPNVSFFFAKGVVIAKVRVENGYLPTLRTFFDHLGFAVGENLRAYRIFEARISLAALAGDTRRCLALLNRLERLGGDDDIIGEIVMLHRRKCGAPYAHLLPTTLRAGSQIF